MTKLKIEESRLAEIRNIIKRDIRYRVRKRASAILYKEQEYSVKRIAKMLEVRAEAVYEWIAKYKAEGIESFYDKKGKGRKNIIQDEDAEKIRELVINCPSVAVANAKVREKLNIFVHKDTLRNYLKKTQIILHTGQKASTQEAK
jgi:transposase